MTVRFIASVASLPAAPLVCHAEVFLSLEQAQRLIFPGETLAEASLILTERQKRQVEQASGVKVRDRHVRAWRTPGGGLFLLDTVTGKHEEITYACGIATSGQVKQIEVMAYREAYGQQVRNASWRKQFVGATVHSDLTVGGDIRHLSGATFSCGSITDGVRRLLHTHAIAFSSPSPVPATAFTVC
ncbi:FMN-binding protein [Verrucomicrobium spinosum]|uniref:FMN-binding protein n=1 Tax=Verrucomicrobium spinosum TaxID=2736 RepID=UPI0001745D99|nr:FMN-binding protein [Verrucomicrobium spinosum]